MVWLPPLGQSSSSWYGFLRRLSACGPPSLAVFLRVVLSLLAHCTRQAMSRFEQAEAQRNVLLENEKELRSKSEEANRLKDEFLATLSHELRTPLNAILGWASLLISGRLETAEVRQAAEVIERNTKVQAQLVDDLLDMNPHFKR